MRAAVDFLNNMRANYVHIESANKTMFAQTVFIHAVPIGLNAFFFGKVHSSSALYLH